MKQMNFGQLVTILANIGVLAGIVFVALEIRQANRIAIGTTSYELNRNWMDLNDLYMTSPEVLAIVVALADKDFVPKDLRQQEQVEAYVRRLVNNWVAIEEAYNNGIASEAFYSMAIADVKAIITKRPGVVPAAVPIAEQYDLSHFEVLEPLVEAIQARHTEAAASR